MSRKYDKAPARKIGVINQDKAVSGTEFADKIALDIKEVDDTLKFWLKAIYLKLDSIDMNLKIINDIEIEDEI